MSISIFESCESSIFYNTQFLGEVEALPLGSEGLRGLEQTLSIAVSHQGRTFVVLDIRLPKPPSDPKPNTQSR